MKITKLSLAAIAAMTLTTGAMADIDMKVGGQAVVYYQTLENGGNTDLFAEQDSSANVGVQINANADIGNGFGLGLQGTALNTLGLEGNLVDGTMQSPGTNGDLANAGNYFSFTKAYLTKEIANTTLKLGRQELPKSLSPLAFSEGWNVFKNTFDAVVAINSDLPDTTLVGAYVSRANNHGDLSTFVSMGQPEAGTTNGKGAYMLTVQNKSVKGLTPTVSYYELPSFATAIWADVKADMNTLAGVPVTVALQGGQTEAVQGASGITNYNAKQAGGVKVAGKAGPANLSLAYTKVGVDGAIAIHNIGTGVKTPLYTQMVFNQNNIKSGADATVLAASMPAGPGKLTAKYGMFTNNAISTNQDSNELDLIYTFKALGTDVLAAYVRADSDLATDPTNIIRLWSRYNF